LIIAHHPTGHNGAIHALASLLDHPSAYMREGAVYGLERLGDFEPSKVRPHLQRATEDPNQRVSYAAAEALGFPVDETAGPVAKS